MRMVSFNWKSIGYNSSNSRYHYGEYLEVFSDGTVKNGGREVSVLNYFYDSDVDCIWATSDPFIKIDRNDWYHMDDVMKDAGYVHGDDANLKNPGILHKDGDYMNFASGNLEWVRQRDPRYKNYIQQKKEARRTRDRMLRGE